MAKNASTVQGLTSLYFTWTARAYYSLDMATIVEESRCRSGSLPWEQFVSQKHRPENVPSFFASYFARIVCIEVNGIQRTPRCRSAWRSLKKKRDYVDGAHAQIASHVT